MYRDLFNGYEINKLDQLLEKYDCYLSSSSMVSGCFVGLFLSDLHCPTERYLDAVYNSSDAEEKIKQNKELDDLLVKCYKYTMERIKNLDCELIVGVDEDNSVEMKPWLLGFHQGTVDKRELWVERFENGDTFESMRELFIFSDYVIWNEFSEELFESKQEKSEAFKVIISNLEEFDYDIHQSYESHLQLFSECCEILVETTYVNLVDTPQLHQKMKDKGLAQMKENSDSAELKGLNTNSQVIAEPKVGRNDICPCGSGKKYKKCCMKLKK